MVMQIVRRFGRVGKMASSLVARHSPWQRYLVVAFLGGFLLLGLATWRDYGMTLDLPQSRNIGMTNMRYVVEKFAPSFLASPSQQSAFAAYPLALPDFTDRDYGVAYELPVTILERVLDLQTARAIFQLRHLCTFLVSWVGVLALYGIGKRRYGGDWRLGLLAASLLVFSPRLFGEMFYNDKDAVFMAASLVATYTTVRFVERPTWRWALGHALACAVAIDVRLMAVLWPVATLGLLGWRAAWGDYRPLGLRQVLAATGVYAVLLPGLVIALWPNLWAAPGHNFKVAFNNMKHFRWDGDILYRGELVNSLHLPWHYSFTWIGVTTPLLQLGLLLVGLAVVVWQLLSRGGRLYRAGTREWQDLLFLALGAGPLVAVLVFHSVLYDGWRQLYFVYPSLLLVALRGLVATAGQLRAKPRWQRGALAALVLAGLLSSAGQMVWMHPYESLYFNMLAGPDAARKYEHDYWGIAFKEGLQWIDEHDSRSVVRVTSDGLLWGALSLNYAMMPLASQGHIQLVADWDKADYYIGNYRRHPQDYDRPFKQTDIKAGNQRIMTIFASKY